MKFFCKTTSFALFVTFSASPIGLVADQPPDYPHQAAVGREFDEHLTRLENPSNQVITPPVICRDDSCQDIMDTRNYRLIEYRRMFKQGRTPNPCELQGIWRGVNKGIVTLVGYKQFIKEIQPCGSVLIGDNIQVHQVSNDVLRCYGWQPKVQGDGQLERIGKFVVKPPKAEKCSGRRRISPFAHGAEISYRDGGNDRRDPVRLLVDRVVMIDNDHVLGRATAKFGLVQIPLAYFVLERTY